MTGIVMPNGVRYRISSIKRYLVVAWDDQDGRWAATYRTDDYDKAVARWRHAARYVSAWSHLVDTSGPAVIK